MARQNPSTKRCEGCQKPIPRKSYPRCRYVKLRFCSTRCSARSRSRSLKEKFWGKVKKGPHCWEWQDHRVGFGYGQVKDDSGKDISAHRASWELTYGLIPDGLFVLHSCDNPSCVRPDHLFLGDQRANMKDRDVKGRTLVGSRHGMAKLTEESVREIRRRAHAGETDRDLAREFQVDSSSISCIARGKTWRHVGGPTRTGSLRGSANRRSKLSEEMVLEIRCRAREGESNVSLAKAFRVDCSAISLVVRGRAWKHVGGPVRVIPGGNHVE